MTFRGFPTIEAYCEFNVFEQTRTEGDVTTYEVVDRLDPAQLASRIVHSGDTLEAAIALRDLLRRQYATQLELTGAVRTVQR